MRYATQGRGKDMGAKTTTPNANLNLLPDASIELQQVVKRERSISAGSPVSGLAYGYLLEAFPAP